MRPANFKCQSSVWYFFWNSGYNFVSVINVQNVSKSVENFGYWTSKKDIILMLLIEYMILTKFYSSKIIGPKMITSWGVFIFNNIVGNEKTWISWNYKIIYISSVYANIEEGILMIIAENVSSNPLLIWYNFWNSIRS